DCDSLSCDAGTCVGVEFLVNAHCFHRAGRCVVGQCNHATDTCQATTAFANATCNDSDSCTASSCNERLCSGPQVDCSAFDSPCGVGTCDPDLGCFAQPLNDGDTCSDGDACTTGTVCNGGSCGGGEAVDCSHLDTGCQVGSCNQVSGQCQV